MTRGIKPIEDREYHSCKICGKIFLASRSDAIYCSKKCVSVAWRNRSYPYTYLNCKYCGKEFKKLVPQQLYCSRECGLEAERVRKKIVDGPGKGWSAGKMFADHTPNRICDTCGKAFYKGKCYIKRNSLKNFCSHECRVKYWSTHPEMFPQTSRRSNVGTRQDLGIFVRSSWEANYARYLNWLVSIGEIIKWEYEPETFEFAKIKKGTRFYTPDFKITNKDGSIEYHEIKGYMDDVSKTKIKRFGKYYPGLKLILIEKDQYKAIAKQVKNFIENWE